MEYAAADHQLAQVHLQAAVAQAALGEFDAACARLDVVLALQPPDLLAMARATAAYVDSTTLVTGIEWATGKPMAQAEEQTQSLDERWPPARALTLRLMSAWSSNDPDSFDALFSAAANDSVGAGQARDLFVFALEWTQNQAAEVINPQVMVKRVCAALNEHGPDPLFRDS